MGAVVDREAPFYFTKSPTTLVMAEGEIAMRRARKTIITRWNWCLR